MNGLGVGARALVANATARVLRRFGVEAAFERSSRLPSRFVGLNVGSGAYQIPGFIDLDVPSVHYGAQRSNSFIPFDLRADELPFEAASVDAIYCSHVIEHVEEQHVARFLSDSARVLRPGGVLRIVTPDGPFLWEVSRRSPDYWSRRADPIRSLASHPEALHAFDYFVHEVNTPAFRQFLTTGVRPYRLTSEMAFEEAIAALGSPPRFDIDHIGGHISAWSLSRIERLAGYLEVIPSKFRASVSPYMRGPEFDRTHPEMSLCVDLVKPR